MNTKRNTAAIYVRRSAADERDADDSAGAGVGSLRRVTVFQKEVSQRPALHE